MAKEKNLLSWAQIVHTCYPSYSEGADQKDRGSKPAPANSSRDSISKIPNTKGAGRVAQGVGPEFKPQYWKKKIFFILEQFITH
jgi:hypothetical protein